MVTSSLLYPSPAEVNGYFTGISQNLIPLSDQKKPSQIAAAGIVSQTLPSS